MTNFLQAIHGELLKVVSVRYFETSRGQGFEAKTNYANITIWNNGNGGGTFIEPASAYKMCLRQDDEDSGLNGNYESEIERLVDDYEGVNSDKPWICKSAYKEHIVYDKHPAISRTDNETEICSNCGELEAIDAFRNHLGITDEDGKAEMWSKVYGHLKDNVDVSNLKDEYKGSLDEVDDKMQYDEDWEEDWDEEE